MQQRLIDIGSWLKVNGEGIYKTRKRSITSQKIENQTVYFTTKKGILYCIFSNWYENIEIDLLKDEQIKRVSILGLIGNLEYEINKDHKLKIQIPKLSVSQIHSSYAWILKIELSK